MRAIAWVGLAVLLLACGGGQATRGNVTLRNAEVIGHHEDFGIEGMRLNGTILEVSLGRACYDTIQEPVVVLGTPVYDNYGRQLMSNNPHETACVGGWPAGYTRLLTPDGEYPGQANGGGRADFDVSQAPSSFWTRTEPATLELPNLSYTLDLALNDGVRQDALSHAQQGAPSLELSLAFNDGASNNDGRLDPGETASLTYTVVNVGSAAASQVLLAVNFEATSGILLDAPVDLGAVAPGESRTGEVSLHSPEHLASTALVFEGVVEESGGQSASDRVVVPVAVDNTPDRAWVWYEQRGSHAELLPVGAARLQSVLTSTGRYVFVADEETRARIQGAVDQGGGSAEDRFQLAVRAAGSEAIERVFQLQINPMSGDEVQLVLAVYDTGGGDRVFLSDATVPAASSNEVLAGFESLGRSYLAWLH